MKTIKLALLLILLYFGGILIHGYVTDWKPAGIAPLEPRGTASFDLAPDSALIFSIWNVGYGGLGAESDFFYDDEGMWHSGSSMIRSPKELVLKNEQGALGYLKNSGADFFLLQEVDERSDRSHNLPQYHDFCSALPGYTATLALNYQCSRVPIPILEPWHAYGAVRSGVATFSRYAPVDAARHQLPGAQPFPKSMFELDRCLAVQRYKTAKGSDLVVINLHNSAYDPGDKIKALQLPYLRDLAFQEFEKGNYVILGGDWNQCPPFFKYNTFTNFTEHPFTQGNVPSDLFPSEWTFAFDPAIPTNRKTPDPYTKGRTNETLIDFFLVSPNVQVLSVKGIHQEFAFSDHQPVEMRVKLK